MEYSIISQTKKLIFTCCEVNKEARTYNQVTKIPTTERELDVQQHHDVHYGTKRQSSNRSVTNAVSWAKEPCPPARYITANVPNALPLDSYAGVTEHIGVLASATYRRSHQIRRLETLVQLFAKVSVVFCRLLNPGVTFTTTAVHFVSCNACEKEIRSACCASLHPSSYDGKIHCAFIKYSLAIEKHRALHVLQLAWPRIIPATFAIPFA